MNNFLKITTMLIAIFIALSSCSKDEPNINEIDKPSVSDNYYVRYVIKSSPYYINYLTVTTPEGIYISNGNTNYWTQTYGPVKKGFTATATAQGGYPTIEIYASKNQEPFALKTTKTSDNQVTASYTIDF